MHLLKGSVVAQILVPSLSRADLSASGNILSGCGLRCHFELRHTRGKNDAQRSQIRRGPPENG
jgi:hypothetical protein